MVAELYNKKIQDLVLSMISPTYNWNPITVTPAADVTIMVGTPVSATGIATSATDMIGVALEDRALKSGVDEMVNSVVKFEGMVLKNSCLPASATDALKQEMIKRGCKIDGYVPATLPAV